MLRQLAVNIGFGLLFWAALSVIGVPYAFLWGCLAALLRFIPYVGTSVALCFPLLLSVAVFPDWARPLLVVIVFLCLELCVSYVVEPHFFSDSAGVSPIGLLMAAAFWTWLWGPIGLVLSNPTTVCLVVLGRHLPQLHFLDVLMSPRTPLQPWTRYYHLLLAHDQDDAVEMLEEALRERSLEMVGDRLLVPTLVQAKADRARDEVPAAEEASLLQAMQDTFAEAIAVKESSEQPQVGAAPPSRVLVSSRNDPWDGLGARYLVSTLVAAGCPAKVVAMDKLFAEVAEQAKCQEPQVVCLVGVAPSNLTELRRTCQRLRSTFAQVRILVVLCGSTANPDKVRKTLTSAGARAVAFSLVESSDRIKDLLSVAGEQRAAG